MDHQLIQLVARLKIRLRQDQSISLNPQRFFAEREYMLQVLDAAQESESTDVVVMALELRDRLGLLVTPPTAPTTPAKTASTSTKGTKTERYRFGARS